MSGYAPGDLRAGLDSRSATSASRSADEIKPAQWIEFLSFPPCEISREGSRTWYARSTNAVISYSLAKAGDVLTRDGQPDEYVVLHCSESAAITAVSADEKISVSEPALVIIPPGASRIEILTDGVVIRLFSVEARDLRDACLNASAYAEPDLRCAPLEPWPDPVGGFRLRTYPLVDFPIAAERFGRIFRTTNMMVNFLAEEAGPRDAAKLSPHEHDDFEQISLALQGRFVHHIRYPWVPDANQWRDDEHREIGVPSICIIPPRTVHTTQGVGAYQQLVDIFSPPRSDFSKAGWVLNADDYPEREEGA